MDREYRGHRWDRLFQTDLSQQRLVAGVAHEVAGGHSHEGGRRQVAPKEGKSDVALFVRSLQPDKRLIRLAEGRIDPCKTYGPDMLDRKSTRLNSSHGYISYAVFCLKKKNKH